MCLERTMELTTGNRACQAQGMTKCSNSYKTKINVIHGTTNESAKQDSIIMAEIVLQGRSMILGYLKDEEVMN